MLSVDPRTKGVKVESYGGFLRDKGYGIGDEEGDGVDAPQSHVSLPPRGLSIWVGCVVGWI